MKLGLWALRTVVGGLFVGHGMQKLAGKFGGHRPDATGQFFESLGLRPGKKHALAAGAAEAGGGARIAAGAFTPAASALLSATMITAMRTVHAPKGPWASEGGYEYNLVLLAAVFAITDAGPATPSIDAAEVASAGVCPGRSRSSQPAPRARQQRSPTVRASPRPRQRSQTSRYPFVWRTDGTVCGPRGFSAGCAG